MKIKISRRLAVTMVLLAAVMAICAFFGNTAKTASAAGYGPYEFEIEKYDLTYDISANCSMEVTEDITIHYLGYASTGFLRDIPVNDGAMVQKVSVKKILPDETLTNVWYDVYSEDSKFVTVDIGDSDRKKDKSERYLIKYKYIILNNSVDEGTLPINAVGTGWECAQNNVSVKLILPDGYKNAECFTGTVGSTTPFEFDDKTIENGRTVLTAQAVHLYRYEGITFYLHFEDGAIKSYTDYTPYIFAGLGLLVLLVIVILRLFVFNKGEVVPVVNFEAPDGMDPLLMGKLIDNRVDNEDITSLIYYFADKGYLKINLDDKDDPTLIRTVKELPAAASYHEKTMFNGLFGNSDIVKPSELKNKFYKTVEKITRSVNKQSKGLYTSTSMGVSVLFALLSGLVTALAPVILMLSRISIHYLNIISLALLVPMLIIYAVSEQIKFCQLKYSVGKKLLFIFIILILTALTCLFNVLMVPDFVMGILPKIVICTLSCISVAVSVILVNRSDKYTAQLGEIIGFKNFILLAEKDKLEKLLEDNPDFYFHVLPYAQVLGVSDKWEEKFKDITVQPPQWATSSGGLDLFDFMIINSCIRHSMSHMTADMVSRPSSSGSNGGGKFGGGFGGGGFSGGGFGGGGGRGR